MKGSLLVLLLVGCGGGSPELQRDESERDPRVDSADGGNGGTKDEECQGPPFACGKSEQRPPLEYKPPRFRVVTFGVPGGAQDSYASGVNSRGQLTGTVHDRSGGTFRTYAFRFSEERGLEDLGEEGTSTYGRGINDDGVVLGSLQSSGPDRAFVADGSTTTILGPEYAGGTHGWAINASGDVVGDCDTRDGPRVCRYVRGSGWHVYDQYGSAMSVANDGTHTGTSGAVGSAMYVMDSTGTMRNAGPLSAFPSVGYGISPNGRSVVGQERAPRLTLGGVAVWIDLTAAEPPRIIEDVDKHPWRDLYMQPLAVNDAGFVVGIGEDWRGNKTGFLYDPRRGQTFDLNDLVEPALPVGQEIGEARAISNSGFVAATVYGSEEATVAALLVPLDWSNEMLPARQVVTGDVRYEAKLIAQSDDLPGQEAIAIDDQGRVAVHEPIYLEELDDVRGVTAWRQVDGASNQLFPAGEFSGEVFPARASGNGNLVGSGWIRDEFTDLKFYRPFLSIGGANFSPVAPPEWAVHLFGYGVDDEGNLLAECLTPEGYVACTRDPQGSWVALFLGRPHAFSKNGLVGGETEKDAVIADAKNILELGLGPGAAVYALSRDGRYAAGVAGHAFVYDRQTRLFDWLPDFAGDPATVGRVLPRAVNGAGTVVGVANEGNGRPFAFAYDAQTGRFVRLQEHVGASDLHLTEARDVNDRGEIAVNAISNAGRKFVVHLRPLP